MTAPRFRDDEKETIKIPSPRIDDSEEEYSYTYNIKKQKEQDRKEENGKDILALAKRWKNRRRMAWISLLSMLIVTALVLFTNLVEVERLKILTEVITWFYFSCASIIGAYMGFTTWASRK